MLYTLRFFSSKCILFHNAKLLGSCIIHILYTGCSKIKKNNSVAKGLISPAISLRHVAQALLLFRLLGYNSARDTRLSDM